MHAPRSKEAVRAGGRLSGEIGKLREASVIRGEALKPFEAAGPVRTEGEPIVDP
jgi:hypothetical protein